MKQKKTILDFLSHELQVLYLQRKIIYQIEEDGRDIHANNVDFFENMEIGIENNFQPSLPKTTDRIIDHCDKIAELKSVSFSF